MNRMSVDVMKRSKPPAMPSRASTPRASQDPNQAKAELIASVAKTLSEGDFKKRVLLKLVSSPWTLWPFLLGITVLLVVWAFSLVSGVAVFAGLLSLLGSVGVFFTRYLLGNESLAKRVVEEIQKDAQEERIRALDDLDDRLSRARDGRPRTALRDLRALMKAFHEEGSWTSSVNASSTFDILSKVEELCNQCVLSLEKTLDLSRIAQQMATPEAREPILEEREKIIQDVFESIRQLGKILAGIQGLGVGEGEEGSRLARVREDLDRSLEVARVVEKRMQSLDREIHGSGPESLQEDRSKSSGPLQ